MRVCMVAYTFYERDNRVMRYSEALMARGDTVDVIALGRPGQARVGYYRGAHICRIQARSKHERKGRLAYLGRLLLFLLRSAVTLASRHLRYRYAVVHIHSVPDFEVFAGILPKLLGAKLILDIHDIVPEFYSSKFGVGKESFVFRLLVRVERLSVSFANHTLVANDIWRERLLSRSARPETCTTIMNYPDPSIFHERPRKASSGGFVLLYPGTINRHQGLDIAVRAFALMARVASDAKFVIYGDGPARSQIERLVDQLGLSKSVLLRDMVPMELVADFMADAQVGVIPKRSDSFGDEAFSTKSLEFMALGVPLIISDTRIDLQFFPKTTVQFFRSGDVEDLASKMILLYRDVGMRKRLADNGRAFVAGYSWDTRKHDYLRIVDALAGRPRL